MAYACDAESSIRIGAIQQDSSIPAMVKIDELLGKHFAVLGTTGTGKSCAVALILRRILEKNPQAHILLLDRSPRICRSRSSEYAEAHPARQHEPAVLAVELRRDRRNPDRRAAEPRDRHRESCAS